MGGGNSPALLLPLVRPHRDAPVFRLWGRNEKGPVGGLTTAGGRRLSSWTPRGPSKNCCSWCSTNFVKKNLKDDGVVSTKTLTKKNI